jgi:glycosyltransferase involved in cell wall biosynthesis
MLNKDYNIKYINTNHTPQTILAGFVLNRLGYVWVADIYDSPHIGLDIEGSVDGFGRVAANIYNILLVKIAKKILNRADLIIVAMVPTILEKYNICPTDKNVLHITNGVSIEQTQRALTSNTPDRFTLVYVGPVRKARAIGVVFSALEKIDPNVVNMEIKLIGEVRDEDERWLNERLPELNSIKITVKGQISHDEALVEIDSATVGLCPLSLSVENYQAAYPIKMFEYMALGKPTIATRTEGTETILQDGESGFLVDAGDSKAMANAIQTLYNSPQRCEQMGSTAAKTIEQYDWSKINQQISERIYTLI